MFIVDWWLPEFDNCRIWFLQRMLSGEVLHITGREVHCRDVGQNWPDWAVKNVWELVKHKEKLRRYLPVEEIEEGIYPDRLWFWGICFTVLPFWANTYYEAVLWKKRKEVKRNPNDREVIEIPEEIR